MQIQPECVPCLLKRCLYETMLVDESLGPETMRRAMDVLREEYKEPAVSADVATEVHRAVYELLGTKDPYKEIKDRCNQVALQLYPKAEEFVKNSENPFAAAVLCSIAGNVLDFGIASSIEVPEELIQRFNLILQEGLGRDDTGEMVQILKKGGDVFVFGDNCGEIVFDRLLIQELKKFNVHLTYVVRGEPILTDATEKDARALGIDGMADEVATTNTFAVGVPIDSLERNLRDRLKNASLIISKGMANWESFSEHDYRPIAHLLRTKCKPVADSIGEKQNLNIAKLFS
ncbi:MAG: DUF89 domain-containing protein [Thermoplasmata archaeon]